MFIDVDVTTVLSNCILIVSPWLTVVVIPSLLLIFKVPPNAIEIAEEESSLILKLEFVKEELAMLDSVLLEALIVLFVKATELVLVTIAVAPANKFNSVGVAVSVIDEPLPNAV